MSPSLTDSRVRMHVDPSLVGLIVVAAFAQALWYTLVKLGQDQLVINAVIAAVSLVLALVALPFAPIPNEASWPYISASAALGTVFFVCRGQAYRFGDVNRIVPLMRGTALVTVAVAANLIVGEALTRLEIGGLGLILMGVLALTFVAGGSLWDGWKSAAFAIATGLTLGAFTFLDGVGVRHSGTQIGYLVWIYILGGLPIMAIALARRREGLVRALRSNWLIGGVSGLLAAAVYSVVVWAFSSGAMAPILALRETSIVLTALSGSTFFREPFALRRVASASLIVVGVFILNA